MEWYGKLVKMIKENVNHIAVALRECIQMKITSVLPKNKKVLTHVPMEWYGKIVKMTKKIVNHIAVALKECIRMKITSVLPKDKKVLTHVPMKIRYGKLVKM